MIRTVALLLLMSGPAHAGPMVTIALCQDGETCTSATGESIRIACIDVPEMQAQPRLRPTSMQADALPNDRAIRAVDYLSQYVVGKQVFIQRMAIDRNGRTVAELYVDDINVGHDLVRRGHADIDRNHAGSCAWTR